MSWKIILENENRENISALSEDFTFISEDKLKKCKLLRYLDAYGDTVFNGMQMDDLFQDFNYLNTKEKNPLINEILMLINRCKNEPHTYLVFYGD